MLLELGSFSHPAGQQHLCLVCLSWIASFHPFPRMWSVSSVNQWADGWCAALPRNRRPDIQSLHFFCSKWLVWNICWLSEWVLAHMNWVFCSRSAARDREAKKLQTRLFCTNLCRVWNQRGEVRWCSWEEPRFFLPMTRETSPEELLRVSAASCPLLRE